MNKTEQVRLDEFAQSLPTARDKSVFRKRTGKVTRWYTVCQVLGWGSLTLIYAPRPRPYFVDRGDAPPRRVERVEGAGKEGEPRQDQWRLRPGQEDPELRGRGAGSLKIASR